MLHTNLSNTKGLLLLSEANNLVCGMSILSSSSPILNGSSSASLVFRQFHHHYSKNLLISSPRISMPLFKFGFVNFAVLNKQKCVPSLNVSCSIKKLSCGRGVSGNLNYWRRPNGDNMLYKYFWSDTVEPITDSFISSCLSPPHSANETANVSLHFEGSSKNLNSEDSTANSDKYVSAHNRRLLIHGIVL